VTSARLSNGRFKRQDAPLDRYWAKVQVGELDECWNWTAYRDENGYGRFSVNGRYVLAHRFAYEALRGPIPQGLEPDHLCRNHACENPWHMELVTHRVNTLRGIGPTAQHAVKTHCLRGHPFNTVNTRVRPNGSRLCRACKRERNRLGIGLKKEE